MNRILVIVLFLLSLQRANAQWGYEDIPPSVSASFEKQFPDIPQREVDWDWESGGYEGNFTQNEKKHKGFFDHEGNFLGYEVLDVEQTDLPIELTLGLKYSPYETWKIENINELHTEKDTLYEIEVKNGKHDEKVYYNKNGTPIKKEAYNKGRM